MALPDFWDDADRAKVIIDASNGLRTMLQSFDRHVQETEDLLTMLELIEQETEEEHDVLLQDWSIGVERLVQSFSDFELTLLLNGPYDRFHAIVELHPGAGGTESQDWCSMLYRMFVRWAEQQGYVVDVLHYLPGEEAGIKSVAFLVKGHNAYGYLKAEKGVHRLVRCSPFDASGRRHTSFASCDVVPDIAEDTSDLVIRSEDLKIDTYRASGAGGQHINKTDSAVRMTHIPTGTIVACQSERSQIANRDMAMRMLRAKLFDRRREEQQRELQAIRGEHMDNAWGSQIRSYVFHPYTMVKDHRTGHETGNGQAVIDGELNPFIHAYLRGQLQHNAGVDT